MIFQLKILRDGPKMEYKESKVQAVKKLTLRWKGRFAGVYIKL